MSEMKMYVWTSEYLKEYSPGQLIAVADNINDAAAKLIAAFDEHLKERFDYLDLNDEYDKEVIEEKRQKFYKDLTKEPVIVETLFVRGSE